MNQNLSPKKLKVFLLEDDEVSQTVFKYLIEHSRDCCVVQAYTLKAAFTYLETRWDILFVDLHLPDGETIPLIEQYHQKHPDVPIIVITAYITNGAEIFAAGAREILIKPISSPMFNKMFELYIDGREKR